MLLWFFYLTFVIPITYSVFGSFISMCINILMLVLNNSWNTFYYFLYMIRNGWDLIKIWLNMLNFWLVMLLSWRSRSHSFGFRFFLIATMEFFFYYFIMLNRLDVVIYWNLSFFLYLRNLCFVLFIRILIGLVSNKPISLEVILLSGLFFL